MVKRIKGIRLLVLFLLPAFLVGCFNYRDINKVTFSTSTIFDIDDFGRTIVYVDCVKPYRNTNDSSDKGKRIIYKGIGKTTFEALKDVNLASSYEINYSQNRAYIFTERAATSGIKKYMDLINNNQEFQIKPYMFVYYGDVEDLLKVTSSDEEYLGLYLEELVHKNRSNPRSIQANVNDYLSKALIENNVYVVGDIQIKKDTLDKKIELNGASVLKNSVLVERIDDKDAMSYNLLMNNVKWGNLEIANPQTTNGFITLEILQSNTQSDLKIEGDKVILVKNLEMRVSIAEAQGKLVVDKNLLNYIKDTKEKQLENYLYYVFKKYKDENIDVFDVTRLAEVKYPKLKLNNPIDKSDIEINVNLTVDGTQIVKDSL